MYYFKEIFQLADASDDIDVYNSDITDTKKEILEEELAILEKEQ